MRRDILAGVSLYPSEGACLAVLPLVEERLIEGVEWTVDVDWYGDGENDPAFDAWVAELIGSFADQGRLFGHGVSYSPCTALRDRGAAAWLERFARDRRRYRHVTEHWGFSRARGIERGAPLPLPACEAVVASTTQALRELGMIARVPVGLENLALALSAAEVDAQPAMIARTLDAIDGILLLDLHNVWCQAVNFGRDARELASRYPLGRVRQIHVAGGSWSESAHGEPVRRDTHDGAVPPEVLDLLAWVIPRCPALELVVLERIPEALQVTDGDATHAAWRDEWRAVAEVVHRAAAEPVVAPPAPPQIQLDERATADDVARFQDAQIEVLLGSQPDARARLLAHPGAAPFRDEVAAWQPRFVDVAQWLARRWSVTG